MIIIRRMSDLRRGGNLCVSQARGEAGFSRVDLISVLVSAVLLSLLAASTVRSASGKAIRVTCLANLKSIAIATTVYTTDNAEAYPLNERFQDPAAARARNWVSGWLDFNPSNPDNFRIDPELSLLANELAGARSTNATALRCPSDPNTVVVGQKGLPRVRSYSLNPYVGGHVRTSAPGGFRPVEKESGADPNMVLFLDENGRTIDDGSIDIEVPGFGDLPEEQGVVRCSGLPGAYHERTSNATAADGSVQRLSWKDERIALVGSNAVSKASVLLPASGGDSKLIRSRFVKEGNDRVKLFVARSPSDADVEWSPDRQSNWKAWSPEYTTVGYGHTKIRAAKDGFEPREMRFDTMSDPTRVELVLKAKH